MAEVSTGALTIVLDEGEADWLRSLLQTTEDRGELQDELLELAEAIGVELGRNRFGELDR